MTVSFSIRSRMMHTIQPCTQFLYIAQKWKVLAKLIQITNLISLLATWKIPLANSSNYNTLCIFTICIHIKRIYIYTYRIKLLSERDLKHFREGIKRKDTKKRNRKEESTLFFVSVFSLCFNTLRFYSPLLLLN